MIPAPAQSLTGPDLLRRYGFPTLKWLVYGALLLNVPLYFLEEWRALDFAVGAVISPGQLIQGFASTTDTVAWVVLLLMFELETSVLDDSRIRGGVRRLLHGLRAVCALAIVYAFTGYWAAHAELLGVSALGAAACERLDEGWSVLVTLRTYVPLTAENCGALGSSALQIGSLPVLASPEALRATRLLTLTDVINAGTWILVVVVLEIEVRLQWLGRLSGRVLWMTRVVKPLLYGTLFLAAGWWGLAGGFLEFWDASLWLFAFLFIELNVFDWQKEGPSPIHAVTGDSAG